MKAVMKALSFWPTRQLWAIVVLCWFILGAVAAWVSGPFELPFAGRAARVQLFDFHDIEQDGARRFRWTQAESGWVVGDPGIQPVRLAIRLGTAGPGLEGQPVRVSANDRLLATLPAPAQPRTVQILIPQRNLNEPDLRIVLRSPTTSVAPDPRVIGVRLEGATLAAVAPRLPNLPLLFVQGLFLVVLLLLGVRLNAPQWAQVLVLVSATLGMAAMVWFQPLLAWLYFSRLAIVLAGLLVAVYTLLPLAEQRTERWGLPVAFIHAACAIILLACLIRLIGALYPLYQAHDLSLNVERLLRTVGGSLVASNRSFEFRSGVTIYPPGPYLAYAPLLLLGVPPMILVQGGNALTDGIATAAIIALASMAGLPRRVALLAGFVSAALPVMLTSLYWGHSAQIFGQALMAPIALTLLIGIRAPQSRGFLFAAILTAVALLTHIGVSILLVAWLGLAWVLLLIRRILAPADLWKLTWMLVVAGLAGLALVYGPALAFKLEQTSAVGQRVASESYASQILIWRALQISFYQLGLYLLPIGLVLAMRQLPLPRGAAELALGWVVACLIFFAVEFVTGLQVRYLVFFAPLACILIGLVLNWIAARMPTQYSTTVAWGLAMMLVVQGCLSWYNGTFFDVQMSMVPLLR
jgi:hypothetical protein